MEDTKHKVIELSHDLIKDNIYHGEPGGLPVYVIPKPDYEQKYAVLGVNYGSIDQKFIVDHQEVTTPAGIAHFLEHKLFDKETEDIFQEFSKYGASPNAFTSFNHTGYLFNTTDNFYPCLDILLNFVQEPYFSDASVKKEIGIIEQEIKMNRDNPDWRAFFNMLQSLYHNHPVRDELAGNEDDISKVTSELLYTCYNTFYHPSNMVLFVVGDLSVDKTMDKVEANMSKRYYDNFQLERITGSEPDSIYRAKTEEELNISRSQSYIGFKDDIVKVKDKSVKEEIIMNISLEYLVGDISQLFHKLYNNGVVDDRFNYSYTKGRGYGYSMMGGSTNKPNELIQRLEEGLYNILDKNIEEEQFMRVKHKYLGDVIRVLNSFESLGSLLVSLVFEGESLFEYVDIIRNMTKEQLEDRMKAHFDVNKKAVSIIRVSRK